MTSQNKPAPAGKDNTPACADDCACPSSANTANDNTAATKPAKKRGWLRGIFGKSALCTCSGASGFLIGHAGCVITPLVMAAVGVTTATAGVSLLALGFGAAATAGGIYAWHRLRGQQASKFEKRLVIGSALSGLLISGAMMHFNGHDHHGGAHDHMQHGTPTEQTVPANDHKHHHGTHDHSHMQHGGTDAQVTPAAAAWFAKQSPAQQRELENMARLQNSTMAEFLNSLCITPAQAPAQTAPRAVSTGMKPGA